MGRIDERYHNGVLPLMGRIDDRVSYSSVLLDMGRIDDRVLYWSMLLPMGRIDEGYHNGACYIKFSQLFQMFT